MPTIEGNSLVVHVAPAPFNDRFARILGSGLTPQQVTAVLSNADLGYMWSLADLLDEIRERDGHLHSELQKREARLAGAPWELMPPEGSGAYGETIAKWCTERLGDIEAEGDLQRSFADAVSDLQGAVFYGRAGHEVTWQYDGSRWFVPRALSWIHPRRFAYTTDWRLHLWDASGTSPTSFLPQESPYTETPFGTFPGVALDRFPAGKFLIHRPRVRGVLPTREGLGRLCVWWSTFKRFDVRDLMAYAEWAGRGLRLGRYASGTNAKSDLGANPANEDDKAVLDEFLDKMSSSVSGSIPDTCAVEIVSAPTNNDVHSRILSICNAEMSKAILGGTLGSEVGSTGGNRALGEVHERNELMIAQSDAQSVAATLRRGLLRPMVEYNFGAGAPVPRIVFSVAPSEDVNRLAERLKIAVKELGVAVGQRDARNLLGFPDPSADDALCTGEPPKPVVEDVAVETTPATADPSTPATAPQTPTEPA